MTPPSQSVSAWDLRALFNKGGYYERIKRGDYKLEVKKRPAPPHIQKDFGAGTLSVETVAKDKGSDMKILKTHHYESPIGEILHRDLNTGVVTPDGKMDPKRLFHEGVLYHLDEAL